MSNTMREILFRGKRIEDGEWIYGGYSHCTKDNTDFITVMGKDKISYFGCHQQIQPETRGLCTGLTDKNGKKIFEGDIVKGIAYSSEWIGVIEWIGQIASFGIRYTTSSGGLCKEPTAWENSSILKAIQRWKSPNEFQAVIIGNIHDNPELLEV